MDIELTIEAGELTEVLTGDEHFVGWVQNMAEAAAPDVDLSDYVHKDNLLGHMQDVFNEHDSEFLGISSDHRGLSVGEVESYLTSQLLSLPDDPADRCELGKAFQGAVVKVLRNLLYGDLEGADHMIQTALQRVGVATDGYRVEPEPLVPVGEIPSGERDHRYKVTAYVTGVASAEGVCRMVTTHLEQIFGTRGNPVVTVVPAPHRNDPEF